MSQYNLRTLPSQDYAPLHAGEDQEFHDSFEYPPVDLTNDHGTSPPGVRNGQSSTPRATTSDVNDNTDDIPALNAAIAQAKADNAELERRAETVKLKAELHALHQRNAHLQSQAAARPDLAPGECGKPREPSVTIKELRADPALTAKVSSEIEGLGLSSSDSEDEGDASLKKKAQGKKLQSGKTAKLMSHVLAPQHWPYSFVSLGYVSKERPYDELTLAEFTARYASILQLNSLPPDEHSGHLDHFVVLMYLLTQFPWPVIRGFHAAVLFEIECGRARWGDSFAHLESRLLRSTTKSSISSPRPSGAVLFRCDFQTGKCSHTKDHYGTIRNERKWLQHICARFWTSSRTIARHSEFSAECPGSSPSSSSSFDPPATTSP